MYIQVCSLRREMFYQMFMFGISLKSVDIMKITQKCIATDDKIILPVTNYINEQNKSDLKPRGTDEAIFVSLEKINRIK